MFCYGLATEDQSISREHLYASPTLRATRVSTGRSNKLTRSTKFLYCTAYVYALYRMYRKRAAKF